MDVRGVGAGGPAGTEFSSALRALAGPKGPALAALAGLAPSGDTVTTLLRELSESEVAKLLEVIERPLLPENAARLPDLFRASVSAVAEGNIQQALVKLAEFAKLNPRLAESLEAEPELASIRADVGQLLFRLASAAQLDAESRLRQATQLLQAAGSKESLGHEIRPEIALLIAGRLLEAGGYANCMLSAEFSQMPINQYGWAPTPPLLPLADPKGVPHRSAHARPMSGNRWMQRVRRLWQRAPLLVLLLVWLAVGIVGGSVSALLRSYAPQTLSESLVAAAFEVWGMGFLALVGFGFYMRVRHLRR